MISEKVSVNGNEYTVRFTDDGPVMGYGPCVVCESNSAENFCNKFFVDSILDENEVEIDLDHVVSKEIFKRMEDYPMYNGKTLCTHCLMNTAGISPLVSSD